MDNLTCNMCGSPDVKLEGNYYICNSCGSKYRSHDFNELSSNERTLTEEEKAELERLKTYLEKDNSLAERILELEPNNWLAYRIEYGVDDRWFELLRDRGMTQKEIEKALTIHYYEKRKDYFVKYQCDLFFDSNIDKFFKDLNSKSLHILSILGDEYSELTKSWQEDAEKFIDECKETEKRNLEEKKERDEKEDRNEIITTIFTAIGCLGGIASLALGISLDGGPYYFWIVLGAICLIGGFWFYISKL